MKKVILPVLICTVLVVAVILCCAMDSGEPEVYVYTDGGTSTIIGVKEFDKETAFGSRDADSVPRGRIVSCENGRH